MNLIDCCMYFDEDMLLDIRLNILDKYVKKFIICEAEYNHNGLPKKLNFNIEKFKKFKDKIIYLPLNEQPKDLILKKKLELDNSSILDNALKRENFQRNYLSNEIQKFSDEDLIIVSDIDEIPNLEKFQYKNKITIFMHKMFYYKLNLIYPNFLWPGSKICKKKHLISPQWLRNVKTKIYPQWRIDVLFSNKKYYDLDIVNDGGWHFTNIKTAEQINHKMKNFLHHLEYEKSGLNIIDIKNLIDEKKILYDYHADQKENKWNSSKKLESISIKRLPNYININKDKFAYWLD